MTAKEYLSQAYKLDQRITSKLDQAVALKGLATRVTSVLSDMPKGGEHRTEDRLVKLIDLENEINADIDRLVDLKREIAGAIDVLPNPAHRMVLEQRYLCFKKWREIARASHYCVDNVMRLHAKALAGVKIPENAKDSSIF